MDREDILLVGLAAGSENATFSPVQVQKLFFLLDREASHLIGGPHFNFTPYDYGPFDRSVYDGLDALARQDLVRVQNTGRYRMYSLSQLGYRKGSATLNALPVATRSYIAEIANWVRQLSFEQLVASIYMRYPDMKANSVFRG